jgi:DnaJ-class molecular chaperone
MYIESLDLDIINISKYTREDIKSIYKKIALECHPDKLCNIKDANVKNAKIERFKKASIGYKKALDDFDKYGELISDYNNVDYNTDDIGKTYDMYNDLYGNYANYANEYDFWHNAYNEFFSDKDAVQKTFIDVAKLFFKKGFKKKDYYNPSTKVIKHDIILPVSYYDLHNSKKKRIQILLKGVDEPFNISILCKKEYPCVTRQYIDDNGIEHEVKIKMMISNIDSDSGGSSSSGCNSDDSGDGSDRDDNSSHSDIDNYKDTYDNFDVSIDSKIKNKTIYTHKIKNNIIDLITVIDINLKDYLIGSTKVIKYIDESNLDILIQPFNLDNIVIKNKGLMGGDLVISLVLRNISKNNWDKLIDNDKDIFTKYLDNMYIL